jgi:hypothetical protein
MDDSAALRLLQAMIDYFEAGNQESDSAAKAIIESDFENGEKWRAAIKELLTGEDWTGLRAPEADIVAAALRSVQGMVNSEKVG